MTSVPPITALRRLAFPGCPAAALPAIAGAVLAALVLAGCGGSGGQGAADGTATTPPRDGPTVTATAFEGSVASLSAELAAAEVQWQQIEGPPLDITAPGGTVADVSLPWLVTGPAQAVVEARAVVDGQTVRQRFELEILDRRYLAMRVHDAGRDAIDLALRYVSANDAQGVPDASTVWLSTLPAGRAVCNWAISPSGQHIAYTLGDAALAVVPVCRGIHLVDIASGLTRRLSRKASDGQDVVVGALHWSPDGSRIAYLGDHGKGQQRLYSIDLTTGSTHFLADGTGAADRAAWPTQPLFEVGDGGNPFEPGFDDNPTIFGFDVTWMANGTGLAFLAGDVDTGEGRVHLASALGDARRVTRLPSVEEMLIGIDEDGYARFLEAMEPCRTEEVSCAVDGPLLFLETLDGRFQSPSLPASSLAGHLMFTADILSSGGTRHRVMAVTDPVVDGARIELPAPIEAFDVFDAAWSPTAVDLAFAANSSLRHVWAGPRESTGEMPRRLTGYEIPGELYVHRGFEPWHSTPQERLSLAEPAVDDRPVVRLAWSPDGRSIAYGRGETGSEGTWLSSLWVVQLGATRDESATGIAQRTELLDNLRGSPVHVSEFTWAPDGAGLLALVHDATRPGEPAQKRLRYLRRDGQGSFDSPALTGFVSDLASLALSFSPDGRHYAYVAGDPQHADQRQAVYVQAVDGGDPVRASVALTPGTSILGPLPWSPHGDAFVYGTVGIGSWAFFLARPNGFNQPLAEFFDAGQTLREIRVK